MDIYKEIDKDNNKNVKRKVRSVEKMNEFVSSSTNAQILEKSDNIVTFTSKSMSFVN